MDSQMWSAAVWSWVLLVFSGGRPGAASILYPLADMANTRPANPEYGFMAGLVDRLTGTRFCSGVFVAKDMVVTTASCVSGKDFPLVEAGSFQKKSHDDLNGIDLKVPSKTCRSKIHDGFSATVKAGSDIALLFLEKAVESAEPIRRMRTVHECPSGALSMVGWLEKTDDQIVSKGWEHVYRFDCEIALGLLPGGVVCAKEGSGSSQHPAWNKGSALLCDGRDLVGLLAGMPDWGQKCTLYMPHVFLHVLEFKEWIEGSGKDHFKELNNTEIDCPSRPLQANPGMECAEL